MQVETPKRAEDVNRDGIVDISDLIIVALQFGDVGNADTENDADVNGDGVIDIEDILLVAGALAEENAAPSKHTHFNEVLSASEVQQWLMQAQKVKMKTPAYQKGITILEQILHKLIPKKTALLPNYPNPFNPETWIPYQLEKPSNVTIHIYASDGHLVRSLALGHKSAGVYQSQTKAAYWNGKNQLGEPVSSGIYFYTLTAAEFTATQRMVIRK